MQHFKQPQPPLNSTAGGHSNTCFSAALRALGAPPVCAAVIDGAELDGGLILLLQGPGAGISQLMSPM
jgi:hypothetical protein